MERWVDFAEGALVHFVENDVVLADCAADPTIDRGILQGVVGIHLA